MQPNHVLYLILFVFSLLLLIYMIIRLRYGFWYHQPVFHAYDFRYYIFPPGIIEHDLPEINRYTNLSDIETITFTDDKKHDDDDKLDKFIDLIQKNYLKNKDNIFAPKKENIVGYFKGHNESCFFSYFNNEYTTADLKKNTRPIAVMTTRPLHVMILNGGTFNAYYVDYLCVDINYRKKGTAQQIIQTHHYNQRRLNRNIQVSLFKREGQLTGIVPLCVYSTYGFDMKTWTTPSPLLSVYKLIKCNSQNIRFMLDFMKQTREMFDICISPELANVVELMKTNNIFIYYILDTTNSIICSAYFFRKTCTFIQKNKECLSCFASIKHTEDSLFIHGFRCAVGAILPDTEFQFIAIEDISHNGPILEYLQKSQVANVVSPTAYFFYNFAYPTFKPERVMIIT